MCATVRCYARLLNKVEGCYHLDVIRVDTLQIVQPPNDKASAFVADSIHSCGIAWQLCLRT